MPEALFIVNPPELVPTIEYDGAYEAMLTKTTPGDHVSIGEKKTQREIKHRNTNKTKKNYAWIRGTIGSARAMGGSRCRIFI